MGRFYFHVRPGNELISDDEGMDLPDLSAAQHEAMLGARELLAEAITCGMAEVAEALVIANEAGQALDTVPLANALPKQFRK